ncbi:MAG: sugar phosphate isomerase/epimerase family protein [Clostridia bacterium]
MAKQFIISGFADEISSNTDVQFAHLNRLGISWFEPRGVDGTNVANLTEQEAKALKQKMDKAGIRASSVGSPIGKISITDPFEPHLEKLRHVIELAGILDTRFIRIFSFYIPEGDSPERWREPVLERMSRMADMAAAAGVQLLHENEGKIYGESPEGCLDILQSVDSPALGCVYDPANFTYYGYPSYPDAFALLKDRITYFHMKDAILNGEIVPVGQGDGGVGAILSEMPERKDPYFLSIEPHLGRFTGLDQLEADGRLKHLPDGGPDVFGLAFNALTSVLEEIGAKWQ